MLKIGQFFNKDMHTHTHTHKSRNKVESLDNCIRSHKFKNFDFDFSTFSYVHMDPSYHKELDHGEVRCLLVVSEQHTAEAEPERWAEPLSFHYSRCGQEQQHSMGIPEEPVRGNGSVRKT